MKKIINIALVLCLCVLLTGCGKTVKCTSNSKQKNYTMDTEQVIKTKGDIVTSITTKYVIESKDKKILKDFKKQLEDQSKSNNASYKGYDCKASIKGNKLNVTITADYKKFDLDKFVKDNPAMKDYVNKDNKLTVDGAKKLYKASGATCK